MPNWSSNWKEERKLRIQKWPTVFLGRWDSVGKKKKTGRILSTGYKCFKSIYLNAEECSWTSGRLEFGIRKLQGNPSMISFHSPACLSLQVCIIILSADTSLLQKLPEKTWPPRVEQSLYFLRLEFRLIFPSL